MVVYYDIYLVKLSPSNYTWDNILLICDLECDIIIRTPWKIVILANWDPDLLKLEHIIHSYQGDKDIIYQKIIFINTTHMI